MSGVASETGNISPTMVAKIVIDNIMVTPARKDSPDHIGKQIEKALLEIAQCRMKFFWGSQT